MRWLDGPADMGDCRAAGARTFRIGPRFPSDFQHARPFGYRCSAMARARRRCRNRAARAVAARVARQAVATPSRNLPADVTVAPATGSSWRDDPALAVQVEEALARISLPSSAPWIARRWTPRRRSRRGRSTEPPLIRIQQRAGQPSSCSQEHGMADAATLDVLVDGLTFPEGPRWHDGRLWFSDFYSHRVLAADRTGRLETIVQVPQRPSGLGWTPDRELLGLAMLRPRVGGVWPWSPTCRRWRPGHATTWWSMATGGPGSAISGSTAIAARHSARPASCASIPTARRRKPPTTCCSPTAR